MAKRGGKPAPLGEAVKDFLRESGLEDRVGRAAILVEWSALVGPQIAQVTTPQRVTEDGTLFVAVASPQWMTELSLMEVQLLARINAREGREPVRRIRWALRR